MERKLKLFCLQEEDGSLRYFTFYNSTDFYAYIVDDYMRRFDEGQQPTLDEAIEYLDNCPYIDKYDCTEYTYVIISDDICDIDYTNATSYSDDCVEIPVLDILKNAKHEAQEIAWCW